MKLTALCVTYNRPEFARWLIWNMEKQTRPADETIILASAGSAKADYSSSLLDPRIIRSEKQVLTSDARQRVMDLATGDMIVWYDDDDWYCKEKNEILERTMLEEGNPAVALFPPVWWYLKLGQMEGSGPHFKGIMRRSGGRPNGRKLYPAQPILPLYALRTEVAQRYRWDPGVYQGSDSDWMRLVREDITWDRTSIVRHQPAMFIFVHTKNVYQTRRKKSNRRIPVPENPMPQWKDLSKEDWDETRRRVAALEIP